ncbi:MAG: M24 family metallopeptidase [Acidobacteriia bacterium]|nr:M24 family metallopeptidase [Terriglobia bacterium]
MAIDIAGIQAALKDLKIDGWLLYDFHGGNPIARKVVGWREGILLTRRWWYWIPQSGEPTRLHSVIEPTHLDFIPGKKILYLSWRDMTEHLREMMSGATTVAMEYSPNCAIPYLSRVDAGTVELVRSLGKKIVSSKDLVQFFESRWTDEQVAMHHEAERKLMALKDGAYAEIGARLRRGQRTNEFEIQQWMWERFETENLTSYDAPIVAVNQNSGNPHYGPTAEQHKEIHKGDFVLIDYWAKLKQPDAVYADYTWTGFCGPHPSDRHREIFDIVIAARDAAVDYLKQRSAKKETPFGWEVDDVSRGVIDKKGYGKYFIHRTGHNIGLEVHGNGAHIDNFETQDDRQLIPRTCFSIEPGIYLPNEFGVRSEIDVYMGPDFDIHVTGVPIQKELLLVDVGE